MVITHKKLLELVEYGVVRGGDLTHVNGSSIDVHLGDTFLLEVNNPDRRNVIDVAAKKSVSFYETKATEQEGITISPGQFMLASTKETFHLPAHISALFVMKSSVARCGLDQMNAAWCSPGWTGSALTLELLNVTRSHTLLLRPGMAIGQMVFFAGEPVPNEMLYSKIGSFNNQPGPVAS